MITNPVTFKQARKYPKGATHYRKETPNGYEWVEIPTIAKAKKKAKKHPAILSVIKTNGIHSWVNTNEGVCRKQNVNIPAEMLQ